MVKILRKVPFVWCLTCCLCFLYSAYQLSAWMFISALVPGSTPRANLTDGLDGVKGPIVLTTTNAGFLEMTENMLESIKRTGSTPNVIVIAEDDLCYDYLFNRTKLYQGVKVLKTNSGQTTSKKLQVGSKIYNQFVNKRARYILHFLQAGFEVLFVDVDTFWVKDPFKDIAGDFDIAMHNEVDPPRKPVFCDGFAYYRPTINTLPVVREWVHLLETTDRKNPDQKVLNRLINREIEREVPRLLMKTLDPAKYPDGRLYYRIPGWREKHFNETVVMHFSYLHGYDDKVQKLKELGWWLV